MSKKPSKDHDDDPQDDLFEQGIQMLMREEGMTREAAIKGLYDALYEELDEYMNSSDKEDDDRSRWQGRGQFDCEYILKPAFLQIMERDYGLVGETNERIAGELKKRGITLGINYGEGSLMVYQHDEPLFLLKVEDGRCARYKVRRRD